MPSRSILATLAILATLLSLGLAEAKAASDPVKSADAKCAEDEVKEAEYAFRNCEDSTKANVFQKHGQADVDVCEQLDNYFVGCRDQLTELARCKGQEHVDYIKRLSITSLAQVLDSIPSARGSTKAQDCSVFHPTTTTTTTTASTWLSQPRTSGSPVSSAAAIPTIIMAALSLAL